MQLRRSERGDTLIEVLVAVVALSLVVTICYGVMTRGFAQGQTALERTTTQGMVSGQIAILRDIFARHEQAKATGQADPAEWTAVKSFLPTNDVVPSNIDNGLKQAREACVLGENGSGGGEFYFNPATSASPLAFLSAKKVRQATYPVYGDGMWVEGYRIDSPSDNAQPYYIFFVKACWNAAISGEQQSMVTNVRFYEAYN